MTVGGNSLTSMIISERQRRKEQMEIIQETVASAFGLSGAELAQIRMAKHVAIPRQIAMYLSKQLTEASMVEIAQAFGKHYTTVLHSIAQVEQQRRTCPDFELMIHKLLRDIAFQ
jgi:chromosomal replication initiator protein